MAPPTASATSGSLSLLYLRQYLHHTNSLPPSSWLIETASILVIQATTVSCIIIHLGDVYIHQRQPLQDVYRSDRIPKKKKNTHTLALDSYILIYSLMISSNPHPSTRITQSITTSSSHTIHSKTVMTRFMTRPGRGEGMVISCSTDHD